MNFMIQQNKTGITVFNVESWPKFLGDMSICSANDGTTSLFDTLQQCKITDKTTHEQT